MTDSAAGAGAGIRTGRSGQIGIITLDRPKALNALDLAMIRTLDPVLDDWAADPEVRAVVIRGAGDRAFCAGGDVRAVWQAGRQAMAEAAEGRGLTADFFREEYLLNHRIHVFPKPFIALVDGIAMGGGVGLSVHGSHRVVTERAVFAMPETGIGLFPDVGGGWFLPRFPGETGTYLALTGERLGPADCLYTGYATHHVRADRLEELIEALRRADLSGDARAAAGRVIDAFRADAGAPPLAAHRDAIDRCFGGDSVEAIIDALDREGSDWAAGVRRTLETRSPTSLKVTLAQLRRGRRMDYRDVVTMEYRLSQAFMAGHDFYEGIRAVLVDKDRNPRWEPASLRGVLDADVERHFQPLPGRDLVPQ